MGWAGWGTGWKGGRERGDGSPVQVSLMLCRDSWSGGKRLVGYYVARGSGRVGSGYAFPGPIGSQNVDRRATLS